MAEPNTTNGMFKLLLPARPMEATGERMTTAVEGETEFEHFHRYCLARDLCLGLDVLDVASGEGYGSSILANAAQSVTGVDADPASIAHARMTYGRQNLRFIQGSTLDLPLAHDLVDAVVSFETLEHVREHGRFMAEVRRVLRPGGRLIVSTPERAVYSAPGEPVNPYHLLELTAAEFDSLLRANFKHVDILSQRAVLGSLIVKAEGGGAWRSYERRSLEYIEVSSGLTRAPFLIAIASDEENPRLPSSVYMDRRRPGEVVGAYLQLPAHRTQAAEMISEIGRLSEAVATREAETHRLSEAVSMRETEIRRLRDDLLAHNIQHQSVKAERNAQIVRLIDERTRLTDQLDAQAARLDALQDRHDKLTQSFRWRFVDGLVHLPRTAGRTASWPFRRVGFHKNGSPRGWLQLPGLKPAAIGSASETVAPTVGERTLLDERKPTILVVSHEATRSGAPVLALNLIAAFSERYNVVCLALGGGELTENFRAAAVSLHQIDRKQLSDEELDSVVRTVVSQYKLSFAIANSVESWRALRALKAAAIPTLSLIHEFSSNTRPRAALRDVLILSSKTVFSTNLTLQSVISDFWLYPGASVHIAPQGKCVIPPAVGDAQRSADEKEWLLANLRPLGSEGDFLVLGVGNIELRKGVDLFIQCASVVAKRGLRRRFRFIWIGDGFDPERELAYSMYLSDQIRRAELDAEVTILRSTSQLEAAYETADVLLLPSRLDPLPNVGIDALTRGLPVVCFAQTTGIADFLIDIGLKEYCVAEYLDPIDLAGKVLSLAAKPELRAEVAERSLNGARAAFDMKAYVSKLESIAEEAIDCEARIKEDIDLIAASGGFRSDFYKHKAIESLSENEIVEVYVRGMASGLELRKPMPGFQPLVYLTMNDSGGRAERDPFADFLQKGLPQGPWLQKVIRNGSARNPPPTGLRIALHLHAFYPEQLVGVVERLNLNQTAPDLFVSAVTEEAASESKAALLSYKGGVAEVRVTPNRGRDLGPFLTEFGGLLCSSYDIIGHLHTKKSTHVGDRPFAEAWNIFLLENLIGGSHGGKMLDVILSEMASNPEIGIVYPDDPHVVSWTKNRKIANKLSERMGLSALPEQFNFPVGSMFWARSAVVQKFVDLELNWNDYPLEPVPIDGTLIHAIERLFGVVPAAVGLTSAVTNIRGVTR